MSTPAAAPRTRFGHTVLCSLDLLPHFSIRNGAAEDAASLLVKATIPAYAHWAPVQDMPPAKAMQYLDAFIAVTRRQMTANRPAAWSDAMLRKAYIAVGVVRAVTTAYYEIAAVDLVPGETAAAPLVFQSARAAEGAVTARDEAVLVAATVPAGEVAALTAAVELTPLEVAVVSKLVMVAVGIVPLQGYSLMATGHHYISDPKGQSFKAYAAVEKQFWKSADVAEWFEADAETLRDLIWHKSCHPVSMTIKHLTACNENTKEMLITVGAGSAAARLPAMEADVRAGMAYKSLFDTLRPFFVMFEGTLNSSILDLALETVKMYVPGVEVPVAIPNRDARIPAYVVNRKTAVRWIRDIVAKNLSIAAYCFGFYEAMVDQSATLSSASSTDTLRTAFSLKKLSKSCVPSYTLGNQSYGDFIAAKNKIRKQALYYGPKFDIED